MKRMIAILLTLGFLACMLLSQAYGKNNDELINVILLVQGLTSQKGAESVTEALQAIDGVISAGVNYITGEATVLIKKGVVNPQKLIKAVEKAGFKAQLKREQDELIVVILSVQGMISEKDVVSVTDALQVVDGVISAGADYEPGVATVIAKKDVVNPQDLVKAVERAGFKAKLKEEKEY